MTEPQRFPLNQAAGLARRFVECLEQYCHQIIVAGSIRRQRPMVKDIEILLVSKTTEVKDPIDMFDRTIKRLSADIELERLLGNGTIYKRPNSNGHFTWGAENKLAVHAKSGIAIDFFFTTAEKWFNALIVRTGPAAFNKRVAQTAIDKGWDWHAYGDGFTRNEGKSSIDRHQVTSELDLFQFLGIPFLIPEDRK